MISKQFI